MVIGYEFVQYIGYGKYIPHNMFGRILEENNIYGWIRVKWDNGTIREYSTVDPITLRKYVKRVTTDDIADFYLAQENNGLTDYWSEE